MPVVAPFPALLRKVILQHAQERPGEDRFWGGSVLSHSSLMLSDFFVVVFWQFRLACVGSMMLELVPGGAKLVTAVNNVALRLWDRVMSFEHCAEIWVMKAIQTTPSR